MNKQPELKLDLSKLTAQQRRRLEKAAKLIDEGDFAILEHLLEIEDMVQTKISELEKKFPKLENVLRSVRGKDGAQGIKGESGLDGKDGKDGRDGVDGRDGKNGKDGRDGKDGKNGEKGEKGDKGDAGDLKNISPQELRDLLELLQGDERLSFKAIKINDDDEWLGKKDPINKAPMMHTPAFANLPDVNVVGVQVGQTLQWNGITWVPTNGGGFTPMTTAQRLALSATNGTTAYDTDIGAPYIYVGGSWYALQLAS